MKIGLVIGGYFGKTGVATHVRDLAKNLSERGQNVFVFASDLKHKKSVNKLIKFLNINDYPFIPQIIYFYLELAKIHKREKLDIIHVHDSIAFIGAYLFSKIYNVPTIFTFQASIFSKGRGADYSWHEVRLFMFSNRFVARRADMLICPSREMVECAEYAGAKDGKIIYLLNPIEKSFYSDCESLHKRDPKGKKILFIGQLRPNKGAEYLIKALPEVQKSIKNVNMIIVGDGPLKQSLQELSKKLGVSSFVDFYGYVAYEQLHEIYRMADLFVIPSLNEPMGLVLMQALASGLPIVGSNTGGIPELVKDGFNGYLTEPGNPISIANAIIKVLSNDDEISRMSLNSRLSVENLSWEKNIDKFISIYSGIAK